MAIKYKNISKQSGLHTYVANLTVAVGNSLAHVEGALSAGMPVYMVVPYHCTLKKVYTSVDVDATATSGKTITVLNSTLGTTLVSQTVYTATPDWSAGVVYAFTPSSDTEITAGSLLKVAFSASIGAVKPCHTLIFDINDKKEK